jgi:hypothetical protein
VIIRHHLDDAGNLAEVKRELTAAAGRPMAGVPQKASAELMRSQAARILVQVKAELAAG